MDDDGGDDVKKKYTYTLTHIALCRQYVRTALVYVRCVHADYEHFAVWLDSTYIYICV